MPNGQNWVILLPILEDDLKLVFLVCLASTITFELVLFVWLIIEI